MLKTKKGFLVLTAILALSFVVMVGCGAQDDAEQLTVVGSGGYPPFNFYEGDDVVGFDVDTGAAIAERMGVELNYVTSDWDGLIEGLRAGRYDGILGSMAITDDRLEVVNFTIPYYYSGAQLVVREDSGITNPADMDGKVIGVVTGTTFEDDALELGAEVRLYQDDNQTLMELINGRIDGVITDRLVALGGMEQISGGEQLTLAGELLRLEEMAIAVNKNDEELLEELNQILQEMHQDGTLTSISQKWHNGEDITVK
ncbi:ABC transporter substrate-binding protein [Desulfuribacillus alkaliarsenatis]|uniref:ABC transporter substrate-binding protein n=1 Tax=Desulfuribacillus alkaliarsenatis TaxID=766136 RepID=A0A1E5G117_9FIRM|nr:ABC transporter substrate-binding protein [Desulfuribacillus alkaliarsenatis]OEF96605.1 ABC transporter substrate-binding protein [Desulfuribacillus alkaliarsenatis]